MGSRHVKVAARARIHRATSGALRTGLVRRLFEVLDVRGWKGRRKTVVEEGERQTDLMTRDAATRYLGNRSLRGPCGSTLRTAYTAPQSNLCELMRSRLIDGRTPYLWYELPRVHSLTVTRVEQTNPQKTGSLAGKGISRRADQSTQCLSEALCTDRRKQGGGGST